MTIHFSINKNYVMLPNTYRDDFVKKLSHLEYLANTIIKRDFNFDMFYATELKILADLSLTKSFKNGIKKRTRLNPVTFTVS